MKNVLTYMHIHTHTHTNTHKHTHRPTHTANDGMQNMEDEKQRLESEVQRSKFHETAFIDRGDQLQVIRTKKMGGACV